MRTICSSARRTVSIGIANPTPSAVPLVERIWALIPITRPRASKSGPPEFPRLIGASVWIASETLYPEVSESIVRSIAETTPTESELCSLKGLPIAATGVPTTTVEEFPSGTGASAWARGSTRTTATSLNRSQPTISAGTRSRSLNSTKSLSAPADGPHPRPGPRW